MLTAPSNQKLNQTDKSKVHPGRGTHFVHIFTLLLPRKTDIFKLALKNLAEKENVKIKEILTVDQGSISAQIWMRWNLDHKKIKGFWNV